eukprot:TRINITY_DN40283_c0_g1_i1.p1 TRINITY_DN40283_c0_g1~~TRINITY_DN40283_c0_g1_i1.p1  ORF type:complete len:143 (+),score=14.46 TRINITY_DN40283_c0_g1_i1:552-980(+)
MGCSPASGAEDESDELMFASVYSRPEVLSVDTDVNAVRTSSNDVGPMDCADDGLTDEDVAPHSELIETILRRLTTELVKRRRLKCPTDAVTAAQVHEMRDLRGLAAERKIGKSALHCKLAEVAISSNLSKSEDVHTPPRKRH